MENFNELEEKLMLLISEYADIKKRNAELEANMSAKLFEIEEAKKTVNELVEDREKVRKKVDALLSLLQEFSTGAFEEVKQLKKTYNINLLGHSISVASDAGDEHVWKVVDLVNSKVLETITVVGSGVEEIKVALLTALNIADEYVSANDSRSFSEEQFETKAKQLIRLIESVQQLLFVYPEV